MGLSPIIKLESEGPELEAGSLKRVEIGTKAREYEQ